VSVTSITSSGGHDILENQINNHAHKSTLTTCPKIGVHFRPLHEVGHLLEDITALFEGQELTAEQRDIAKQNIDTLFDSFGEVDSTLHGQDGATYKEVSDEIDAAITALRNVAKVGEAEQSDSDGGKSSED